jgi:tetratricopeptide (TPR) repeat protein
MGNYFSDIHADRESQFRNLPHGIPDTEEIIRLRGELQSREDYEQYIALGNLLGFQLRQRDAIGAYTGAIGLDPRRYEGYRARAPKYLNTLQFEKAAGDYETCLRMKDSPDVIYRLGITEYIRGCYAPALSYLSRSLSLEDTDEMRIAALYWYILAAHRCGERERCVPLYKNYNTAMDVGHHRAYKKAVELFLGLIPRDTYIKALEHEADDMDFCILAYGACVHGEGTDAPKTLYPRLLERDGFWPCFAYIAAYADKGDE